MCHIVILIYRCIKTRASLEVSLLSSFCEFQFQWATTAANIHMPQGCGRWGWWGSDTSNCSWKRGSWTKYPNTIPLQLIWINLRNSVHVVRSFREGNGRPSMVWPRMMGCTIEEGTVELFGQLTLLFSWLISSVPCRDPCILFTSSEANKASLSHSMDSVTKGKLVSTWGPLHARVVVDNKLDSLHVFTDLAGELESISSSEGPPSGKQCCWAGFCFGSKGAVA